MKNKIESTINGLKGFETKIYVKGVIGQTYNIRTKKKSSNYWHTKFEEKKEVKMLGEVKKDSLSTSI